MAAVGRVDSNGLVDFIRLTPGAATPKTVRFIDAEAMLLGQRPTRSLIAVTGRKVAELMIETTGRRWSTEFKEPVIAVLAERALQRVFEPDAEEN
jgi:carbon-monoxide dehydrogenase medium subunit/xanthine dehydrogenase FAD-binding subunit